MICCQTNEVFVSVTVLSPLSVKDLVVLGPRTHLTWYSLLVLVYSTPPMSKRTTNDKLLLAAA